MLPAVRLTAILLAVLLLVGSSVAAPARRAVVAPAATELGGLVTALAAPAMEGRGSGTPGGERAARFIAERLAAAGLRPGGDGGTFLQPFVVGHGTRVAERTALARVDPEPRALEPGREWSPHGGSLAGEVTGEVVFVGHGVAAPKAGWDDYASVDVRGKIALALDGAPGHLGDLRVSRLEKVIAARRRGAAALLIVADALPSLASTAARVNLVSGTITRGAGAALLAPSGRTRAELGAAPAAVATRIEARLRVDLAPEDRHAANVVAILPGTDPALAGEAVVIGAHYDHLGRVGGTVHPGADDNASGTAVVMGLARAFAEAGGLPRTLVFALFAGEELGLLGSAHYVRQPSLPAGRTMAMLNFDMVGRMRDRTLIVGGVETGSGLRAVVAEAARAAGVNATLQDSPSAASDQASFYSADVPVLFFTTGAHDDYHKPSDTPDKIDAAGLARVAAVGTRVIEKLAEGPRPMYAKVAPPPAHGPRGHDSSGEAFFGISPDLRSPSDGLRLGEIVPGTAAARAGLRDGDVLVRFGDVPMESFEDLQKVLRTKRPGDTVDVVYLRDGDDHTVSATLGARP